MSENEGAGTLFLMAQRANALEAGAMARLHSAEDTMQRALDLLRDAKLRLPDVHLREQGEVSPYTLAVVAHQAQVSIEWTY